MRLMQKGLLLAGLALTCVVLSGVRADDEKKKQPERQRPGAGFARLDGPLVSTELADKLKLSADQKDSVAKLQKEFEEKTKTAVDKLKDLREKLMKDRDRDAFQQLREQSQALRKTRGEYSDKVKALLKDDQKKTFEEASARRPLLGNRPGQPGQPARGGAPGNIFSREVQERLGLSTEQKEKLEKIKKELDAKSVEVLTPEQKKKLDDLKAEQPRTPRRRPQQ